jgi:hypothetical protein
LRWQFGFELVSLGTKGVDLAQHPLQQSFGRRRGNSCPLERQNLLTLSAYLGAHAFNFASDEVDVRHVSFRELSIRTKREQRRKPLGVAVA